MPAPDPDSLHDLLHQLVRSISQVQMLDPSSGHPVTVSEAMALHDLGGQGGLTQQELAARLHLDKSTVSRLVAGLSERGLVSRRRDESNRRFVRLDLTEAGHRLHVEVAAALHSEQLSVLAGMSQAEQAALLTGLTGLLREMHRDHTA